MIRNFPETSAQWVTTSNDETVELISDAILLSKCQVVPHYHIYWNRTYNKKCFREFPVLIFPSRAIQFLQIVNRHLIPQGSTIPCNQRPLFTYTHIQDQVGTLWHLSQNGTISPNTSKLLYSHVSPLRFHFAKIRGLNSHLVYPKQHQLDRSSLLDLVSANHQSLQDINAIATSGQGNFLTGLGKLIGITVHSLSKGGSTIIHALGHGIKDGFSGLGTFNPIWTEGAESDPPSPKDFLHNSKTPGDIEKKLSDFNFTPLMDILRIFSITIVVRCCHSNLLFPVCHVIFWVEKTKKLELFSR